MSSHRVDVDRKSAARSGPARPSGAFEDPAEDVRSKEWRQQEPPIERRMNPRDRPTQERGQGNGPGRDATVREQFADSTNRNAANVGVLRIVVDEVVPQDASAWADETPQVRGQRILKPSVQDRSEDGRLENHVEGALGKRQSAGVTDEDLYRSRKSLPGDLCAFLQQLIRHDVVWGKTQTQEL